MKILVVTLSNLGDVVLTLPVLQCLRQAHPQAELDVIVGRSGSAVLEGDARLRRVTVYDKKMSLPEKRRFLAAIRRERYDLLVDLRHSWIGLLGGARKRNSYALLLKRRGHRALKHLESLNGLVPLRDTESFFAGSPSRPAPALPEGRLVAAAVGSKSDLKKWPAAKYAELLARLAGEHGCSIVLVGDQQDIPDARRVADALSGAGTACVDLTGKTDLSGLVSVLRRASLVVTNDSAPLHLADSLKVPTLALFGPSDPRKYGPRFAGSAVLSKGLHCQPCEKAQCRYGHRDCLETLEVGEVYRKASQLLEGRRRDGNFRVLVLRLDRVGDVVLSIPALEALRQRYPDAHLAVMTRPETHALLAGHPAVDEVLVYDYKRGGRHAFPGGYFRLLEEVMKRRFDAAVVLHPGIRSSLVPFLSGIPHRIGYRGKQDWLLTRALPDTRHLGDKHESEYALDLVAALGARPLEGALPRIVPDPAAAAKVPDGRFIALHAGASCPSKRWPAERFRALAIRLLADCPHTLVLVGGPQEKDAARLIARDLGARVLNLAGETDLAGLAAWLSRCELLVSNDSGPVHVAAAVGTRTVSLFGRNRQGLSAARWRPLGPGHAVIQKDVGCLVCLAHACPIEFECLKAITVEEVLAAARTLLAVPAAVS